MLWGERRSELAQTRCTRGLRGCTRENWGASTQSESGGWTGRYVQHPPPWSDRTCPAPYWVARCALPCALPCALLCVLPSALPSFRPQGGPPMIPVLQMRKPAHLPEVTPSAKSLEPQTCLTPKPRLLAICPLPFRNQVWVWKGCLWSLNGGWAGGAEDGRRLAQACREEGPQEMQLWDLQPVPSTLSP